MAETEIFELDKTLIVDGKTYNINAVYSEISRSSGTANFASFATQAEEAEHAENADYAIAAETAESAAIALEVDKKLTINSKIFNSDNSDSVETFEFNGSNAKSIDIVPAAGGRFTGRIAVPPVDVDVLKGDGETVLNYNDIVSKVVDKLLNTSTMATWDSSAEKLTFVNDAAAVNGLCVVKGAEAELASFALANAEANAKWLPDYLYICVDTGNIYLGTSDSSKTVRLAVTAAKLDNTCSVITDLSSTSSATFNGTNTSISPGVSGVLEEKNGGTGQTSLSKVSVGAATNATNLVSATKKYTADAISAAILDLTSNIDVNKANIAKITNGTTTVAKATSATSATSATKATQDGSGNTIATYYQPKILTGTVDPSKSTVTAVKNAPNGAIYIKYTT